MKKFIACLVVVVTVVAGSLIVCADGPWPNPGTGSETDSIVVVSEVTN